MFNFQLNYEMSHEMEMHLRDEYPAKILIWGLLKVF